MKMSDTSFVAQDFSPANISRTKVLRYVGVALIFICLMLPTSSFAAPATPNMSDPIELQLEDGVLPKVNSIGFFDHEMIGTVNFDPNNYKVRLKTGDQTQEYDVMDYFLTLGPAQSNECSNKIYNLINYYLINTVAPLETNMSFCSELLDKSKTKAIEKLSSDGSDACDAAVKDVIAKVDASAACGDPFAILDYFRATSTETESVLDSAVCANENIKGKKADLPFFTKINDIDDGIALFCSDEFPKMLADVFLELVHYIPAEDFAKALAKKDGKNWGDLTAAEMAAYTDEAGKFDYEKLAMKKAAVDGKVWANMSEAEKDVYRVTAKDEVINDNLPALKKVVDSIQNSIPALPEVALADVRNEGDTVINTGEHLNPYSEGYPVTGTADFNGTVVMSGGKPEGIAVASYSLIGGLGSVINLSFPSLDFVIDYYAFKDGRLSLSGKSIGWLEHSGIKLVDGSIKLVNPNAKCAYDMAGPQPDKQAMFNKGCYGDALSTGIVSLDINTDGISDLVVANRGLTPDEKHAFVTIYKGKTPDPAKKRVTFLDRFTYETALAIGLEPYDIKVIDDDFAIVAANTKAEDGGYRVYKIGYANGAPKVEAISVETPLADFGPYQITAVDFGGECEGFAFTSAQIDSGEAGKPETTSIEFTNKFTVYRGEKGDSGNCDKYTILGHYDAPQAVAGEGDAINNPALLSAITSAPANEERKLPAGVWVGDQNIYTNADGDKMAYAYFYPIEGGLDPINAQKYRVSKEMEYLEEGLPGGGVKQLRVDAYGNLGVALGYPKIWQDFPVSSQPPLPPKCPQLGSNQEQVGLDIPSEWVGKDGNGDGISDWCQCRFDMDKDGVHDFYPDPNVFCDNCYPKTGVVCTGPSSQTASWAPSKPGEQDVNADPGLKCYNPMQDDICAPFVPPVCGDCIPGGTKSSYTGYEPICVSNLGGDFDKDGVPDQCDNCNPQNHDCHGPGAAGPCWNPNQEDSDKDKIGDFCEPPTTPTCGKCIDGGTKDSYKNYSVDCMNFNGGDADKDGVPDNCDNCKPGNTNCPTNKATPSCWNPDQKDSSSPKDGVGDICTPPVIPPCDGCIPSGKKENYISYAAQCKGAHGKIMTGFEANGGDADNDGVPDNCDNCKPGNPNCNNKSAKSPCYNPDQKDSSSPKDAVGDICTPPVIPMCGGCIPGGTHENYTSYVAQCKGAHGKITTGFEANGGDADFDGVPDKCDNCKPGNTNCSDKGATPPCWNPDQKDSSFPKNGIGNVCEKVFVIPDTGLDIPNYNFCDKGTEIKGVTYNGKQCYTNDLDCDGHADKATIASITCDNCPPVVEKNPACKSQFWGESGQPCKPSSPIQLCKDYILVGGPSDNPACIASYNADQADADKDGTGDLCEAMGPPPGGTSPVPLDLDGDGLTAESMPKQDECECFYSTNLLGNTGPDIVYLFLGILTPAVNKEASWIPFTGMERTVIETDYQDCEISGETTETKCGYGCGKMYTDSVAAKNLICGTCTNTCEKCNEETVDQECPVPVVESCPKDDKECAVLATMSPEEYAECVADYNKCKPACAACKPVCKMATDYISKMDIELPFCPELPATFLCADPDGDKVCSQKLVAPDNFTFAGNKKPNLDNCPFVKNPLQTDTNSDGKGDTCQKYLTKDGGWKDDTDGDGVIDAVDNCPFVSNSGQADYDKDKVGDECDSCPKEKGKCVCTTPEYCYKKWADKNLQLCPINYESASGLAGVDSDGDWIDDACDPWPYTIPMAHTYWPEWIKRLKTLGFDKVSQNTNSDFSLISKVYADNDPSSGKKASPSAGTVTVLINKISKGTPACECLPSGTKEDYASFVPECVEKLGGDKKPADGIPDTCGTGITGIGECFVDIGRDGKQAAGIGELNSSYDNYVRDLNNKMREMLCKAAQSKDPTANCANLRADLFIGELGYYHITCAIGRETPPLEGVTPGWALYQLGGLPLESKYFAKDNYRPAFLPPTIEIQQSGKTALTITRDDFLKNSATRLLGTVDTPATSEKGITSNVAVIDFAPSIVKDKVQLAMPDTNAFAQNITVGGLNSILVDIGASKSDPLMRVVVTPLPESGNVSQLSISPYLSAQYKPGQLIQFEMEGYAGVDAASFAHPDLAKPFVKLDPNVTLDTFAEVLNKMVQDPAVEKIEYSNAMKALNDSLNEKGANWDTTGYLNMRFLPTMGASQPEIYMNIVPLSAAPEGGAIGCLKCSLNGREAFGPGNAIAVMLIGLVIFVPIVWRRRTL